MPQSISNPEILRDPQPQPAPQPSPTDQQFNALAGQKTFETGKNDYGLVYQDASIPVKGYGDTGTGYWEHPQRVVRYYNLIQSMPQGWQAPTWLDVDGVRNAYEWLKWRNGGKPTNEWGYLDPNDPARGYLQSIQTPPVEVMLPDEYRQWQKWQEQDAKYTPVMGDPEFDWSQLPAWQKWVFDNISGPGANPYFSAMYSGGATGLVAGGTAGLIAGGLPGGVAGAIGGALFGGALGLGATTIQQSPNEGVRKLGEGVLWGLDAFAQGTERVLGVTAQAIVNPREVMANPGAAWRAAELGYESNSVLPDPTSIFPLLSRMGVFGEEGKRNPGNYAKYGKEVYVLGQKDPVAITDDMQMDDIRRRIVDAAKTGEDPEMIIAEYSARWGVSGMLRDMLIQSVADPLNDMIPALEKGLAVKYFETRNPTKAYAMRMSDGIIEGNKVYNNLLKAGMMFDPKTGTVSAAGWDPTQLSAHDLRLAGIMDEAGGFRLRELEPNTPKNFFDFMRNLTPESKAVEFNQIFDKNFHNLWAQAQGDPQQFFELYKRYASADMEQVRDTAAQFLNSPEGYTLLPMMQAYLDNMQADFAAWETTQPNRSMLVELAQLLGEEPAALIDRLRTDGDYTNLAARAVAKAKGLTTNFAKMVQSGTLTADLLQGVLDVFTGDNPLPWHPNEWAASTFNGMSEHAGHWLRDYYGLKADSAFFQFAHLAKAVQSLMLLSFNPAYALNNGMDNITTIIAGPGFGFMTPGQIKGLFDRFGLVPSRLREGFGIAGIESDAGAPGERIVRDIYRPRGWIGKARDAIGAVNKLGFASILAKNIEESASAQAYAMGTKKAWAQLWRRGKGFRPLPPDLVRSLSAIDPAFPRMVYDAIEAGMNRSEIEKNLTAGMVAQDARALVHGVAEKIGMKPEEAADLLDHAGVTDELNAQMREAKTPDDMRRAFRRTAQKAQEWIDAVSAKELASMAEHVRNKVQSEGVSAVRDVWLEAEGRYTQRWFDHYSEWGSMWEALDGIDDPKTRNAMIRSLRLQQAKEWRRVDHYRLTAFRGILDALGLDAREYVAGMREISKLLDDAYKMLVEDNAAISEKYADDWKNPQRKIDIANARQRADAAFYKAFNDGKKIQTRLDRTFSEYFPEQHRKAAFAFAQQITKFRYDEMIPRLQKKRAEFDLIADRDARAAAKRDFYQREYMGMIAELYRLRDDGSMGLHKAVTGQEPPQGPAAPAQPAYVDPLGDVPPTNPNEDANLLAQEAETMPVEPTPEELQAQSQTAELVRQWGGAAGKDAYHRYKKYGELPAPELVRRAQANFWEWEQAQATMEGFVEPKRPEYWKQRLAAAMERGTIDPVLLGQLKDLGTTRTDYENQVYDQIVTGMIQETMTDVVTGMPSEIAMKKVIADGDFPKYVFYGDLDFLRSANNAGNHATGNAWLAAMGDIMKRAAAELGVEHIFRPHGDEFIAGHDDLATLEALGKRMEELAPAYTMELFATNENGKPILDENGNKQIRVIDGVRFKYGLSEVDYNAYDPTDPSTAERIFHYADKILNDRKQADRETRVGGFPADAPILPAAIDFQPAVRRNSDTAGGRLGSEGDAGAGTQEPGAIPVTEPGTDPRVELRNKLRETLDNLPLKEQPVELKRAYTDILNGMRDEANEPRVSLLSFVWNKGGIDITEVSDATGQYTVRGLRPGLFRNGGMSIDDMAVRLKEAGYLTDADFNNPDMSIENIVRGMIRDELAGQKHYSLFEEDKPDARPEWMQRIRGKGANNDFDAARKAITRILTDGDIFNAEERHAKAEAWRRLGMMAQEDPRLAALTGLDFNADAYIERINEVGDMLWKATTLDDVDAVLAELLRMDMPQAMDADPANAERLRSAYDLIFDEVTAKQQELTEVDDYRAAVEAEEQAKTRSAVYWNKQTLVEHLRDVWDYDQPTAEAAAEFAQARAEAWARMLDADPLDWYNTRIEEIRKATPGEQAAADALLQEVFHGSPYKFDKFTTEKIGTGEGAQAYGWGLYFASGREVADWYRETLSKITPSGQSTRQFKIDGVLTDLGEFESRSPYNEAAWGKLDEYIKSWEDWPRRNPGNEAAAKLAERNLAEARALIGKKVEIVDNDGQLYKVDIPDDGAYLLWDKPISEQPQSVQDFFALEFEDGLAEYLDVNTMEAAELTDELKSTFSGQEFYDALEAREGSAKRASAYLNEAGVVGIKYLDGSSRRNGEGNYNYVVFDDNAINILETYYQRAGQDGRVAGATTFTVEDKAVFTAFNADASTFMHEFGHVLRRDIYRTFWESGNEQLKADIDALESFFGVEDSLWSRDQEEAYARAWERYLAEGRAPTSALERVFRAMKEIMLSVYRAITGSEIDVPISDEVRAVFDRLLGGTGEQYVTRVEEPPAPAPSLLDSIKNTMRERPFDPKEWKHIDVDAFPDDYKELARAIERDIQPGTHGMQSLVYLLGGVHSDMQTPKFWQDIVTHIGDQAQTFRGLADELSAKGFTEEASKWDQIATTYEAVYTMGAARFDMLTQPAPDVNTDITPAPDVTNVTPQGDITPAGDTPVRETTPERQISSGEAMVMRAVNGAQTFINDVMEQFGKTETEARLIFDEYRKRKIIKLDTGTGRYNLTHGAFWEQEPIDNALKAALTPPTPPITRIQRNIGDLLKAHGLFDRFEGDQDFHVRLEMKGYEPLVIERHGDTVSIAHYYEQNGDMIADPDVEFKYPSWEPIGIQQGQFPYRRKYVVRDGKTYINTRFDKEIKPFLNMWANNIKAQGWDRAKIVRSSVTDNAPEVIEQPNAPQATFEEIKNANPDRIIVARPEPQTPEPHVNPYPPIVPFTPGQGSKFMQPDTAPEPPAPAPEPETPQALAGGMLPGMEQELGMLPGFGLQDAGKKTQMQAPTARKATDPVPGKTSVDRKGQPVKAGDEVTDGPQVYTVKGVNLQGKIIGQNGELLSPSEVTKIADQADMFTPPTRENIAKGLTTDRNFVLPDRTAPQQTILQPDPDPTEFGKNEAPPIYGGTKEQNLLDALVERITNQEWFAKSRDFESFIKGLGFDLDSETDLNLAYDIMEGAYNMRARAVRADLDARNASTLERLTAMEQLESNLTEARRTLGKMKLQQFSTPLTISEAAARAADVRPGDVVGEPTAGTANLVDMFSQRPDVEVRVNEFDEGRRKVLSMIGYNPTGLNLMASEWVIQNGKKAGPWATTVISNPPWGAYSTGKYGKAIDVPVKLNDWSQRFTYLTLQRLAPDGRFVGIMPANWLYTMNRSTRENIVRPSEFYKWLKNNYSVRAVIESPAGAYKQRATDISSLLVVIDKTPHIFDNVDTIERYADNAPKTWEEYADLVDSVPKREQEAVTNAQESLKSNPIEPADTGLVDPAAGARRVAGSRPGLPAQGPAENIDEPTGGRAPRTGGMGSEPTGRDAGDSGEDAGQPAPGAGDNAPAVVDEQPAGLPESNTPFTYSSDFYARRESQRATLQTSGSFTEYLARSPLAPDEIAHPHPTLIVETKSLAGAQAPELSLDYKPSPSVMRAMQRRALSTDGNIDPIWQAVQMNDRHNMGMLVADDVGMGKSRTAAGFAIDRIEKGKKRILVVTKGEQNVLNLMSEFKNVYGAEADEDGGFITKSDQFPAKLIFLKGESFPKVKKGEEPLPQFDEPTIYFVAESQFEDFTTALIKWRPDVFIADEAHMFKNVDAKRGKAWTDLHKTMIRERASIMYLTATPAVDIADMQYLYGLRMWTMDGFEDWVKIITGQESKETIEKKRKVLAGAEEWAERVLTAADSIETVPATKAARWGQTHEGYMVGKIFVYEAKSGRSKEYRMSYDGADVSMFGIESDSQAIIIADKANARLYTRTEADSPIQTWQFQDVINKAGREFDEQFPKPSMRDIDKGTLKSMGVRDATDILTKKKDSKWGQPKKSAFDFTLPPAHTEQIMREFKSTGVYLSRDISRSGVEFTTREYRPTADAIAKMNQRIEFYRRVYEAWAKFSKMNKAEKKGGASFGINGDLQADAKRALFDMRLPGVIEEARAAIARGEKVVISVVSVSDVDGEKGSLASAISKINTTKVDKLGKGEFSDPEEIPEAVLVQYELREALREMPLVNPLDVIKEAFGDRVDFVHGGVSTNGRIKAATAFQRDLIDVIVISGAGKTGINLHDITGSRRVHLIVGDYEWSATNFKQELGRVDRTGQKSSPFVTIMHTGSAGERKFIATISNRMQGLGAASKGGAESTGTSAMTDEFELGSMIDKLALQDMWLELSRDDRLEFLDHFFRSKEVPDQPIGTLPATAQAISKFTLALQTIEVRKANEIFEQFLAARKALTESIENAADAMDEDAPSALGTPVKTMANEGQILRSLDLGDNLTLSEVLSGDGQKFGVLHGILTPYMNTVRETISNRYSYDENNKNAWAKWVRFQDTEKNSFVSGLRIGPQKIKEVAAKFGKMVGTAHTPENALTDLRAGDRIQIIGAESASWELYLGRSGNRDGRIVVDGAKMRDREPLMKNGASFNAVGGFFYIPEENLPQFFQRFPIRKDAGGGNDSTFFQVQRPTIPVPPQGNVSQTPTLPPGGYDETSQYMPMGAVFDEGWATHIRPLLDAMQTEATRRMSEERDFGGLLGGLDEGSRKGLSRYMREVMADMGSAKNAAMRWGEETRDFALLNYNRRFGFDQVANLFFPYQFWYTRSMANWALRGIERPGWLAMYERWKKMKEKMRSNLPERMRGKFHVPAPYMPDWAGGGIYIDPMQKLFPFANFLSPLEQFSRDQNYAANEALYILREWQESGRISEYQATQAAQQTGPVWEEALTEAMARRQQDANPLDFISSIMSPAWYLTTPYNALTGQGNKISNLPGTRVGWAMEAALKDTPLQSVGDLAGSIMAGPETWVRKTTGLPEFGEFGDYYIDRQLANMAADGAANVADVQKAMIERDGNQLFEQARQRVIFEMMVKVPGALPLYAGTHGGGAGDVLAATVTSLFPGGLLPEGELRYRGLKERYGKAWEAYKSGDQEALRDFFDKYPEYEARLALRREPEDRLRQFLVGQIWDGYMALDKEDRRLVRGQLGPDFEQNFLNQETYSPDTLDPQTLAIWARALGGLVPQVGETGEAGLPEWNMPPLQMMPDSLKPGIQTYYDTRAKDYPNITAIQSGYYSLPKDQRSGYLRQFPQLRQYWDWRAAYIKAHPDVAPFISETEAKKVLSGEQDYSYLPAQQFNDLMQLYYGAGQQTQTPAPDYFSLLTPMAQRQVVDYALTGRKPGAGALAEIKRVWEYAGKPTANAQEFLNVIAGK